MTTTELKEKITAAEQALTKAEATVDRHKKQAEKKLQIIACNGWTVEKQRDYADSGNMTAFWATVEYQQKLEDIKNAQNKVTERQRILHNWREKYNDAIHNETEINNIPEVFKKVAENLVENWDKSDNELKAQIIEYMKLHTYAQAVKKYSGSALMIRHKTKEEIHRENEREAKYWVLALWQRVIDITGENITEIKITNTDYELNGFVKGSLGTARVETILAGGYNIQRLHTRCLVHKIA